METLKVLSQPSELRLQYNDFDKSDEDLRIQYRYLSLRNSKTQSILRKRSTFLSNVRRFMDANHFTDIETPTLLRRTPGVSKINFCNLQISIIDDLRLCYY